MTRYRLCVSVRSASVVVLVAGPLRSNPLQPQARHQLDRNHRMYLITPRDCSRIVTALQLGHRSPSGRIQKKTSVAAMIRSTKIDTKTIAKIAASDIAAPRYSAAFPCTRHAAATRGYDSPWLGSRERANGWRASEALFYLSPGLYVRNPVFDAIDDDLGPDIDRSAVQALRDYLVALPANQVHDTT